MTWIRCSDRMPMGEACIAAFRRRDGHDNGVERYMESANAESLRKGYEEVCGKSPNWIDRTEWRPVEETDLEPHVYTVKPGCDEAVRDLLRSDKPIPERLRELMQWRGLDDDEEVFRAALVRFGFEPQLSMLTEECGELVAAVNRYRRGRDGAFEAMIEEMADVSILIKQMKLVYGDEIEQAEARKLARLKERLE